NLSRPGVEQNIAWLNGAHGGRTLDGQPRVEHVLGDIRDAAAVSAALDGVSRVFHFAAQVAVTTSLIDPIADFEVNARGTLNLLEAIRALERRPSLLFTSTNKVYGHLRDLRLRIRSRRYTPE